MSRPAKPFDLARLFRALADGTRLRLLHLMGEDEICVCFLVEVLKIHQPKISRHLAYLRRAGVVAARREGKWMHYRIVDPPDRYGARVLREVRVWLERNPEMKRDRNRLKEICCSPKLPMPLQIAPRPRSS